MNSRETRSIPLVISATTATLKRPSRKNWIFTCGFTVTFGWSSPVHLLSSTIWGTSQKKKNRKQPYSCKNWKAGFSRSSAAGFTSEKSFSLTEMLRSSSEKGMLHLWSTISFKYNLLHVRFFLSLLIPRIVIQQKRVSIFIIRVFCH